MLIANFTFLTVLGVADTPTFPSTVSHSLQFSTYGTRLDSCVVCIIESLQQNRNMCLLVMWFVISTRISCSSIEY